MNLIEKQQEDGDGRKKRRREVPLVSAAKMEDSRTQYPLDSLVHLAELLHQKGLLTVEEVLEVFDLDYKWEVDK